MEIILPDGSTLMHGSKPYDPVEAHAYYERTKKLKGRRKGRRQRARNPRRKRESFTVTNADGSKVKLSAKQLAEQKAYANHRVLQIKKKINLLNKELRKRMEEARRREQEAKKPDSAAEKADKARESEKYRDKHKQELANKAKQDSSSSSSSSKSKQDSVEGLKTQIAGAKKSLKNAVAKQRSLATAKKNG